MLKKESIHEPFWALSIEEAFSRLLSNPNGITEKEVLMRQELFGLNTLPKSERFGRLLILLSQFKSPLIVILTGAGLITLFLKEWDDALVILGAVVVNALLGFYQENKAENTLALLETYVKERARVVREGKEREIDARELTPGDVIRISQGDRVPADARLLFVNDLQVDESILTGESLPVVKSEAAVKEETELGDRTSMIWSGTSVVQGFGDALVVATNNETELGRIALLVRKTEKEKTPLQEALLRFTLRASMILGVLVAVLFSIGIYTGKPAYEMFLISVATAVSAVPEGLPIALTVILAIGVERLAKRKGVVRKLLAAETLGSTTLILTDKTGTLTQAKMELARVLSFAPQSHGMPMEKKILTYALANTDVILENPEDPPGEWRVIGRPLEVSLVRNAVTYGVSLPELKKEIKIADRLPFNSANKFGAVLLKEHRGYVAAAFGAPDILLLRAKMSKESREEVMRVIEEGALRGERILGVAVKELASEKGFTLRRAEHLHNLVFLGLITFRDPVRVGVKDAIRRIGESGVRTVILTGDHHGTALAVARELEIASYEHEVLIGAEITKMDDEELARRLVEAKVIARVSPEEKLRVAKMYQQKGEVVAMTGDGVNDAPALKEADIGIVVGSGSDVAKASADLVILDDNFETIVAAIEEGRRILQNVRKVIIYLLSSVFDELLLIGGALLFGLALPLNALQILWVNLLSESFPAMALAFESHEEDIGKMPTRLAKNLFDREMKLFILGIGLFTSVLLFLVYYGLLAFEFDPTLARTFIFASFGLYSLFLIFSVRNLRRSILKYNFFSNTYLLGGVAMGATLMGTAIYVPFLQRMLDTVSLPPAWLLGVAAVGVFNIAAIEFGKVLLRGKIRYY